MLVKEHHRTCVSQILKNSRDETSMCKKRMKKNVLFGMAILSTNTFRVSAPSQLRLAAATVRTSSDRTEKKLLQAWASVGDYHSSLLAGIHVLVDGCLTPAAAAMPPCLREVWYPKP